MFKYCSFGPFKIFYLDAEIICKLKISGYLRCWKKYSLDDASASDFVKYQNTLINLTKKKIWYSSLCSLSSRLLSFDSFVSSADSSKKTLPWPHRRLLFVIHYLLCKFSFIFINFLLLLLFNVSLWVFISFLNQFFLLFE